MQLEREIYEACVCQTDSDKDSLFSSDSVHFQEIPFESEDEEEFFSRSSVSSMDSIGDLEAELEKLCEHRDPWDRYERRELIGTGGSGRVYRAVCLVDQTVVAVKEISINKQSRKQLLLNEICALKHISHPRLLPFREAFFYTHAATNEPTIAIVTPFCNYGSLSGICARTVFTERMVAYVIAKIIPALHELHKNQIAHRDLKSDNVLVDENFDIFLSDLGFCDVIDEKTKTCPDKGVIGTPYWMAPEVVKFGETSLASDIWSLGILAIELYDGLVPLISDFTPKEATIKIAQYSSAPLPRKSRFSEDFRNFLELCLKIDPLERATTDSLLTHSFLKKIDIPKSHFSHLVKTASKIKCTQS